VFGGHTADFLFREITLEPLGPDAGRLALPKK
jgi:hypothetical protein